MAEHSSMHQYAAGRSDALDDARIAELIGAVRSALDEGRAAEAPSVPGKRPYVKEGAVPLAPKYAESCRRCGCCVEACPVEAVDATTLKTDKGTCIACMGCVAVCPDRARTVNGLLVKAAALAIKKQEGAARRPSCSRLREPSSLHACDAMTRSIGPALPVVANGKMFLKESARADNETRRQLCLQSPKSLME